MKRGRHKSIVKGTAVLLIGILLIGVGVRFFVNPFSVEYVGAECTYWGDGYSYLKNSEKALNLAAYDGKIPSDKNEEYQTLVLTFDFTNHSILKLNEQNMVIQDLGSHSDRIIEYSIGTTMEGENRPERFSTKQLNLALHIYTGGIKQEELEDELHKLIDSLTVNIISDMDWIGQMETIYKVKDNNSEIVFRDMTK